MESMRFYYNIHMNVCAEENWVVDFLVENEDCEDREEALEGLRVCREFYGWSDCEVSNTIEELISMHYGVW
jgi:hypothetical protein